jgi:hypothetical protein
MNPVHILPFALLQFILILSFHLCLGLPSDLSCLGFLSMHLYSVRMLTTCSAHHKLLNLNTLITYGEGYKSWTSSLRTFLRSSVHVFFAETSCQGRWTPRSDTADRLTSWRRAWQNSGQRLLWTEELNLHAEDECYFPGNFVACLLTHMNSYRSEESS